MSHRGSALGAVGALAVSTAAIAIGGHPPAGTPGWASAALVGVAWLGFGLGAWLLPRTTPRVGAILLLAGAAVLLIAAASGPPRSSDDLYRYLWDGRVQAAGIDPYRYAPAAPELTGLRDRFLWPDASAWCVAPGAADARTGQPLVPGCTLINRPTVHTIYPPTAQLLFLALHWLSPPGWGAVPVQVMASLFAFATTVLLMVGLRRLGQDPRRAVLWAWCPAVPIEAANNGHIDVVAAFLAVAALLVLAGRGPAQASDTGPPLLGGGLLGGALLRGALLGGALLGGALLGGALLGGALLGLAVAVKLTPLAVVPAALRRRPWIVLASMSTVVGLSYVPHVFAVGAASLGYLGGYAHEEGYTDGRRFALLPLPAGVAPVVAAAVLALAAVVAWRTASAAGPWHAAALTTGSLLVVSTPSYPWYALLLVALVGLGARAEWLAVVAGGYVAQYASELHLGATPAQRVGYGLAVAVVLAGWFHRRRRHTDAGVLGLPLLRRDARAASLRRPAGCDNPGPARLSSAPDCRTTR